MKNHYPVVCEVCGGEGLACKHYQYGVVRHRDPQVCANILADKKAELDRREAAIKALESGEDTK